MTTPPRKESEQEQLFGPVFDEAVEARHAGDFAKTIELCERILRDAGADERRLRAITHAELGGIYLFETKEFGLAEHHYAKAAAINPRAELYSLGLFHALTNQDRWEEGLNEMCRYLAIRDSEDYRAMLSESFSETDFPEARQRELVTKARELLAKWGGYP